MMNKIILDVCCGGRTFWFNRRHPNTVYIDIRREEKGFIKERPNFEVNPDMVMDFRDLQFADESFKMVVFDPPHLKNVGKNSWLAKKYGMLGENWEQDLKKGFDECWRVLEMNGVLIFKWAERDVKVSEILKLFGREPLFGHPTGRSGHTKWVCFMKLQ